MGYASGGKARKAAALLAATFAVALSALVMLTGCSTGRDGGGDAGGHTGSSGALGAGRRSVTVFAAASLTETFTELGKTFEVAHPGVSVKFNFGSSATLAQQITQGAPADVFAAASPATMKIVTDAALAVHPTTFVRNRLQIAVPVDNPGKVHELRDLADPKVKVALCAQQVPCGAAAVKALDLARLKVKPVTLEKDVKATLTKVSLGEVDAALVYATDVRAAAGKVTGIAFPEADRAINDYPITVLTKAHSVDLAKRFVELVLSRQGKDVLTRVGFEIPGMPPSGTSRARYPAG